MHMLRTIPSGKFGLLIHNPGVPVIARTSAHQEGHRSIDDCTDCAIRGALMMAIQEIENLVQLLIGHVGMSERLHLNARPMSNANYTANSVISDSDYAAFSRERQRRLAVLYCRRVIWKHMMLRRRTGLPEVGATS